jgi:hypothetical protein
MRSWLAALTFLGFLVGWTATVQAGDVDVRGHYRSDGTYVQPHKRSAPDSSYNNNWSTSPNVNPYTGQQGTHQPRLYDQNPSSSPSFGGETQQPRRLYGR